MKAIIIDDEEDGRESLRLLLEKFCPDVTILEICSGPIAGLKAIENQQPELVFLDVQMPHKSGFDMLEEIENPQFETIFVSAHDQYAIKAIRFSALDFLLKPVDVDDLLSAVQRAHERSTGPEVPSKYDGILNNVKNKLGQSGKLAVPSSDGMEFIDITDIIYCKAEGAYTNIHLLSKSHMIISKSLKEFENILDPNFYCRVHNSYIINLQHIEKYIKGEGGYVIMTNGEHVDVSRRKKEEFLNLISKV